MTRHYSVALPRGLHTRAGDSHLRDATHIALALTELELKAPKGRPVGVFKRGRQEIEVSLPRLLYCLGRLSGEPFFEPVPKDQRILFTLERPVPNKAV